MKLAERIYSIKPSATLTLNAKVKEMRAEGKDVIGFGAGEPDFDTPHHIKEAAIRAIKEGYTKYTPVGGLDELKDAVLYRLEEDYGLSYDRSQVVISCGGKHALFNLAMALFQPGDEVLLPSPYWVSYPDIIRIAGARPVSLPTEEEGGFRITPEQIREALTPNTKALILNSPSNPTGSMYTQRELEALAEVIVERGLLVVTDDIYDRIVYSDERPRHLAALGPELKELIVMVNSLSKTYAMTGWRIGYTVGPKELISAITRLQGQSTSNPTSIAQKAAIEALCGPQDCVEEMVREFDRRRRFMVSRLRGMDGVSCYDPQGAFYVFPRMEAFYGRRAGNRTLGGSLELADYLLEEGKVAVVPGEPFGMDSHIRLSFATSLGDIEEGLNRLEEALNRLG